MTRFRTSLATALLLLAGTTLPAHAQEEAPDVWEAELEFGLNGASGNSSFSILRAGASVTRLRTDLYELDFSTVFRYGTSEERVIANDAKASLKFDWHPEDTWSPFAFVDAARDEVRRLDLRANGGAGVKWAFLQREEAGDLSLSLAGLLDYQNFDVPPGNLEPDSERQLRWSLRFKAEQAIGEESRFEHVSFYQPTVDDTADYMVEVTNTLSTKILDNLTLAMEHLYLRDNVPPPGAARDDQKYSVIFRLGL